MSKRANGEGTISKKSNGFWEIKYYDVNGVRRSTSAKSQALAKEKLKLLIGETDAGVDTSKAKLLFTEWLQIWLDTYAKTAVRPTTFASYHTYIHRHISPHFQKVVLKDLRADQLQQFINTKLESGRLDDKPGGLSHNTVKKMKIMIGTALSQAMISGLVNRNIAQMVKLPRVVKKEMRVLSVEEQITLEKSVLSSNEISAFAIYLTVNTGMRMGEVMGLTWDCVDLVNGYVQVKKTLNRVKTPYGETKTAIKVGPPKSTSSIREIPLFNDCLEEFRKYKKAKEGHIESEYVFTTPLGNYIEPKTMQDLWKRTLKKAGVDDANFHSLRHTFATRSLEAGMDVLVLAKILGHANPSITLNVYGHALPNHKRASMDKLEEYKRTMMI